MAGLTRIICCSTLFLAGCVGVPPPSQQVSQQDGALYSPYASDDHNGLPAPLGTLTPVELPEQARLPQAIDLTEDHDDLFQRIRHGFAMPDLYNDLVLYHQQWYMSRPDYLRRMVERSSRYLHHIVEELDKRGLPMELALLPMVESAYNPMALSRSKASGLWQFIPSTGRRYNLGQDSWKDDRRDIVASTTAALEYLQLIYEMHGDWHLALASYNCGEGAVGRAVDKNLAKGLPTDFLSLNLPNETQNYVPKLQALKNIFRNPTLIAALELPQIPNQAYFTTFTTDSHIDVKLAAKLAEMPVEEFVALNPAHKRQVIKPDTSLVIPAEKLETFVNNLEAHGEDNKPLSAWRTYTLRPGDRLEQIAPRFGTTVAKLREVNGIRGKKDRLSPGQTLLVPGTNADEGTKSAPRKLAAQANAPAKPASVKRQAEKSLKSTHKTTQYTVRRGDTLYSIARRFKVALEDLMRSNRVSPQTLKPGTTLTIRFAENS
ncbi:lytic transglycosylase [Betaproteobacteria bacterium]|nr:lytic transglycosylase [Betaproteobacteria bacterium]